MQALCSWLQATKGAHVQQDWVQACVEWIEQEEGSSLPASTVQKMVYEQWLHADLREVASQTCLPTAVVEQQTTQISGKFAVQADSVVDVGTAAYAQLQKIKGRSLDGVENSGNRRTFEPKPTRLLLLSLTDGLTEFQAMEYMPIPQLNSDLTPGAKLLLQGTMGCRLGTLLLSGSHVQVLGGGVESLIAVNPQKRVLARILKDESLAEEGVSTTRSTEANVVSSTRAEVATDSTTTDGNVHLQSLQGEGNEDTVGGESVVGGMQVEDVDLENFDDFGETEEGEFHQDAQEQWPEEIDFSPQDIREEGEGAMILSDEEEIADELAELETTASTQSVVERSRIIGQKWRPPSSSTTRSDTTARSLPPARGTNLPVASGLDLDSKRSKLRQPTTSQNLQPLLTGAATSATSGAAVASVTSMATGGQCQSSGAVPAEYTVPVVGLQKASDTWETHSLIKAKAHFVRVTGKLKPCDGQWTVAVVIQDGGGGEMNVELSNQVLEKLIGFTAQEFIEHIQPNRSDPAIKTRGSMGFKRCQSCLASLDCYMEIRKPSTFSGHPVVERLLDSE